MVATLVMDNKFISNNLLKSHRGNTSRHLNQNSKMNPKLNQVPSLKSDMNKYEGSLTYDPSTGAHVKAPDKALRKLITDRSCFEERSTKRLPSSISSKKIELSNPLDLGYNANEELLNTYKEHSKLQENTLAKLKARIERLEKVHSSGHPDPEILTLQKEAVELRSGLADAEATMHEERRLVSALHQDNNKLKLQLLQAVQRSVCLQLVSGTNEARVQTLLGSERVRKLLPEALRKVQQSLWAEADEDAAAGNVSPETVLALRRELRDVHQSFTSSEKAWLEERAALQEERELQKQERELDAARQTAWLRKMDEKLSECQRECRASASHCAALSRDLQLQQKGHLKEREALLRALAKLAGPERLRRELQELEMSSSCLTEAEGHASATCQARELKLLSLQLQRELSEKEALLQQSDQRCRQLEREKCLLMQGREEALALLKKQRGTSSEQRQMLESRQQRSEQQLRAEVQGAQADLAALRADLKRLVHMLYKLTIWQADSCPPGAVPPPLPGWLEGPRAVTSLARTLQSGIEAARTRLAGGRSLPPPGD